MKPKYDKIGTNYDTSRRADPYLLSRLVHHLHPKNDCEYLDIACGSGNYTTALSLVGGKWCGLDQSSVMLEKARNKSSDIHWFRGDVAALPFPDNSFDGVTCTLAIHHFPSLESAFAEVRRVLTKGRFVLFTSTTEQMKGYWLNEYFPAAMERSMLQMPAIGVIESAMEAAGLEIVEIEQYSIHDELQDFFLYSGKRHPKMYLDTEVRRGISTFSSLAGEAEIEEGCEKLSRDIDSGKIKEVIATYDNDLGDYCFVVSN